MHWHPALNEMYGFTIHIVDISVSSYIESKVVRPLADNLVASIGDIRELILEDVVPTRSVSVLIEHHSSSCAACLTETE